MPVWTPKLDKAGIRSHWTSVADFSGYKDDSAVIWKDGNIKVYSTQIKQERLVHLENVYRYMHHYLTEEGWKSFYGDPWFEEFYGEVRDAHGHKEIRYWWRLQKGCGGVGASGHPFFRQRLFIDVLCTNMKRVEMMYKGRKIKPFIGEFILWINSILEVDYNKYFIPKKDGGNADFVSNVLEDFFVRMFYKDRIREQEVELRRVSERFVEDTKQFIGLTKNPSYTARKLFDGDNQWF